ncbi:hypothetical protein C9439_00130 [archaeon SCG-AAA382B04]|nr:hypothetical protein C9439_00130 [archaeon SCG-AAA382B04]
MNRHIFVCGKQIIVRGSEPIGRVRRAEVSGVIGPSAMDTWDGARSRALVIEPRARAHDSDGHRFLSWKTV